MNTINPINNQINFNKNSLQTSSLREEKNNKADKHDIDKTEKTEKTDKVNKQEKNELNNSSAANNDKGQNKSVEIKKLESVETKPLEIQKIEPADTQQLKSVDNVNKADDTSNGDKKANDKEKAQKVDEAVKSMNEFFKVSKRNLEFNWSGKEEQMIVTVKEADTGKVIRQIPPDDVLKLKDQLDQFMGKVNGLLFEGKA